MRELSYLTDNLGTDIRKLHDLIHENAEAVMDTADQTDVYVIRKLGDDLRNLAAYLNGLLGLPRAYEIPEHLLDQDVKIQG